MKGGILSPITNLLFGKPPDAPDPNAVAQAQTTSNLATAQATQGGNMVNINGPQGTVAYTIDPTKKFGDPGYATQTTNLSPELKQIYDQELANQLQSGGLASKTLQGVSDTGANVDTSGLPANVTSVGGGPAMGRVGAGPEQYKIGAGPEFAQAGGAETASRAAGPTGSQEKFSDRFLPQFGTLSGAGQGIQEGLNYRTLGRMPTADDETRQRVEQAQYDRNTMYLDPQFQRESDALSAKLRSQGLTPGSEPWQAQMDAFAKEKEQAYTGARNDAVTMGGTEQSRLLANALSIRQQGQGELEHAGAFRNAAQGQSFGQNLSQTQENNATKTASMNARLAALGQRNTAGQQDFQNQFAVTNQQNAAKQQDFDNSLKKLGFNNSAQQQQYSNTLTQMGFNNATDQQEFTNEFQRVTQGNTAAQQEFANLMSNANLTNAQRSQMFSELVTKYQLPLQKYTALFNNAAVNPTVGTSVPTPTQSVAPTDVAGIQQQGFGNQMGSYGTQFGALNALGNIATGAGNFLTGWNGPAVPKPAYSGSDVRLKSNIEHKGFLPSGMSWYEYDKGPVREQGVMAHEVKKFLPQAVKRGKDGYDRVDYSQIG